MPFPIAAAGAGIGILGNIAAYIAAQNAKRKRYPYAEMLQAARNEGLQGANAATANYGLQAGPRYSMQGLQRSGIPVAKWRGFPARTLRPGYLVSAGSALN